jgi:hypothetical protein
MDKKWNEQYVLSRLLGSMAAKASVQGEKHNTSGGAHIKQWQKLCAASSARMVLEWDIV